MIGAILEWNGWAIVFLVVAVVIVMQLCYVAMILVLARPLSVICGDRVEPAFDMELHLDSASELTKRSGILHGSPRLMAR